MVFKKDNFGKINGLINYKIKGFQERGCHQKDDLKQEIFIKLFNEQKNYRKEKSCLTTWAYNIIESTINNYYTNQNRKSQLPELNKVRITNESFREDSTSNSIPLESLIPNRYRLFNHHDMLWSKDLISLIRGKIGPLDRQILEIKIDPPEGLRKLAEKKRKNRINKEEIKISNQNVAEFLNIGFQKVRSSVNRIKKVTKNLVVV